MVRYRKCAVRGCANEDASRHCFPNPKKDMALFNTWAMACKNSTIYASQPDLVYRSYRVCHIHFKMSDTLGSCRLKKTAVPSLCLPEKMTHFSRDDEEQPSTSSDALSMFDNSRTDETGTSVITGLCHQEVDENVADKAVSQPSTSFEKEEEEDIDLSHRKTSYFMENTSRSLLHNVGVTRITELSPKAKRLYKHTQQLKRTVLKFRRKAEYFKTKFSTLNNMNKNELVEYLMAPLSNVVKNFIKSQLRTFTKKPHGRRYTVNDSILALLLHKQGPRAYKLLSKIFTLPSKSTINRLLQKVPTMCGINENFFVNIKNTCQHLNDHDKICFIMFDEMSIQPHIQFDPATNQIHGFEDTGDKTSNKIADHAQVFIVKGVLRKWKQPLCYTFTRGTVSAMDLVRLLKNIINRCQKIGLQVIATVCDQGSTNVAAINYLKRITRDEDIRLGSEVDSRFFKINHQKFVHIYDPPHLIKGIRNNLLTKNLVWDKGTEKLIAKWSDVETAFKIDNLPGELRSLPKLTTLHVEKKKIKKMKVSYAAQVLSYSVAAVIGLFARSGMSGPDGQQLEPRAKDTATIFQFFDSLFDSVNGSTLYPKGGKSLRCAATSTSEHLQFWINAKQTLKQMYFQREGTNEKIVPPSLKNWIETITSFQEILKYLNKNNISFFMPRAINQDAVENFFCQIRQHGHRNTNPSPTSFMYSFRALLLNNMASVHSLAANCEADDCTNIIADVQKFILTSQRDIRIYGESPITEESSDEAAGVFHTIDKIVIGYVAGFITKYLKEIEFCSKCKVNIISSEMRDDWHSLVHEKEFGGNMPLRLQYCTPEYLKALVAIYNIIKHYFHRLCFRKNGYERLLKIINRNVNFKFKVDCEHNSNIMQITIEKFSKLCCFNYLNGLNKVLNGKILINSFQDAIYKQAHDMYLKRTKGNAHY